MYNMNCACVCFPDDSRIILCIHMGNKRPLCIYYKYTVITKISPKPAKTHETTKDLTTKTLEKYLPSADYRGLPSPSSAAACRCVTCVCVCGEGR
jgi:hypothetical protein